MGNPQQEALPVARDARGRVLPGPRLDQDGSNGLGTSRREFNDAALAPLGSEATPEQLAALGVPAGALALLERMEPRTFGAALIAVLTAKALEGDRHARRDLLARLWPAPKPVELSPNGPQVELGDIIRFSRAGAKRHPERPGPNAKPETEGVTDMKHFSPFEWSGHTFGDRIGEPEAFDAAIGKIALNFWELDRTVDRFIRNLAGLQGESQMTGPRIESFKRRVDLLASFVSDLKDVLVFNTGPAPTDEFFGELTRNCLQADALYRQMLGADWTGRYGKSDAHMVGDPAGELNPRHIGTLDAHRLLDIADFICVVAMDLEEFFEDPATFTPEAA